MKKVILTDCDGVLLDWEASFTDWMSSNGYTKVDEHEYDVAKSYGLEKPFAKKLVREFNNSAWMGHLPTLRDARSGVATLVDAGFKFICITSLSLDPYAKKARVKNLQSIFGKGVFNSKNVICLDTGADKDDALAEYAGSGLYWIEDKEENAVLGEELGLKSLLVDHKHNKTFQSEGVKRVANWSEIANIIVND